MLQLIFKPNRMFKKITKKLSTVRMQLAGSVFVAIAPVLVLTYIVNQPWFWQYSPPWLKDYFVDVPWVSLTVGLLALMAAWFGGELFILRQVRALSDATKRLGTGDMSSRTGLHESPGELGQLAAAFDKMAAALQQRVKELECANAEVQKLAAFAQLNPNAALEFAADGGLIYFNEAASKLARSVNHGHPRDVLPTDIGAIVRECLESGQSRLRLETKLAERTLSWSFHPMLASRVVHGYVEDTTVRLSLEAQLRQAQKMESVGQLAAGVAHDFNNMLTIIQGHSSKLLAETSLPPAVVDPVLAIYGAAERAAGLTRQLLMFTRKNVMQPRVLDLRAIVGNINKMLCRLLGETIALEFQPPPQLPNIYGDAGMIEQILMNLAVNAHDAMPAGGTLTISLGEFLARPEYMERNPDAQPGRMVRLQVSDTGCGMSEAVRARIFEPFFTTKEVGKGTGLGLATVFGIVRQHAGWIEVFSEVDRGTTFAVYFPACDEAVPVEAEKTAEPTPVVGGSETLLVVEDEMVLREMAREFLKDCGYRVLEARSGREALQVWQLHRAEIHLLLTDMKMPEGISGLELAERMLAEQPGLHVIFTSGYSDDVIRPEFLERTHSKFLAKPYAYSDLVRLVRECLDHPPTTG